MDVREAVASRFSCRAFRPDPVPEQVVREIVELAARAPSGGNVQPWRVYAIAGARVEALKAQLAPRMDELPKGEGTEYPIFPPDMKEPFRTRRFAVGEMLYHSIDVRAWRSSRAAAAICAQLSVLRRAGRSLFRHRALARCGAMVGSRRLCADRDVVGACLRPCTLVRRRRGRRGTRRSRLFSIFRPTGCCFAAWRSDTPISMRRSIPGVRRGSRSIRLRSFQGSEPRTFL